MVRAVILVKSPKKLIAARLRKINDITESFPVSGQFDAVAVIDVTELSEIKNITTEIQKIPGVERTETMVEVNPLVISNQDQILALDCKMSFDNNALFRRNQVSELRDKTQENSNEVYASDRGLNYVNLEGNIGNIINGAGLAWLQWT